MSQIIKKSSAYPRKHRSPRDRDFIASLARVSFYKIVLIQNHKLSTIYQMSTKFNVPFLLGIAESLGTSKHGYMVRRIHLFQTLAPLLQPYHPSPYATSICTFLIALIHPQFPSLNEIERMSACNMWNWRATHVSNGHLNVVSSVHLPPSPYALQRNPNTSILRIPV